MPAISRVSARQILDSRGVPAVEVAVFLDDGSVAKSSSPSGFSKSKHEAAEIRDGDDNAYGGLGVGKAIQNVNELIAPKLIGFDPREQQAVDKAMIDLDGTAKKENLGANAILPVSQAVLKAGARASSLSLVNYIRQFVSNPQGVKIPVPMFNILEGGKKGRNLMNFQELLVIPATSKSFSEGLMIGLSVYHSLEKMLNDSNKSTLSAEEGGFSPNVGSNQEGLALMKEAINGTGYSFSFDVFLGLDCAANSFWEKDKYKIYDRPEAYEAADLVAFYQNIVSEHSLVYLEDPFAEDDLEGWKKVSTSIGGKTLLAGDDLIATNPFRLQAAITNKIIGGVVIKPNQIGTISEAIAVVEIAKYTGLKTIVSNRSSETEDSFIADFAVGVGADYIKFGAPSRERVIKYNRLVEIEEELLQKS